MEPFEAVCVNCGEHMGSFDNTTQLGMALAVHGTKRQFGMRWSAEKKGETVRVCYTYGSTIDAMWNEIGRQEEEMPIAIDYDPVSKPEHYASSDVEAIDAIRASMSEEEYRGYLKGNVMKYLWRYKHKGKPKEDIRKAQVYLRWLEESL